ncbi:MAG: ABC transporter ATP-binding protein [Phycisphaerae bacterium]|nr:ABC transporter ATP-binding protein [Phycisphaerae bacterium]
MVQAIAEVSLQVQAGEHLAVIGPSGSGKSTLLHLIAGLTSPDAGHVAVGGVDLASMNDRRLTLFRRQHIGMIFQSYNLIPTLTVEDNILLPLLLGKGRSRRDGHIDVLLDTLGLTDRRRHRPDELSGGEQQRVAIARALIADPTVILADEPTGNLDSLNGQKLCEMISKLRKEQKRTIITVTHDPSVAIWADRVLVLRDGWIVETLSTDSYSTSKELGERFLEVLSRDAETVA